MLPLSQPARPKAITAPMAISPVNKAKRFHAAGFLFWFRFMERSL
jgi:hypothetical protein